MRYLVLLVLAVVLVLPVQAKIYKWKMPDGSIRYSDKPQPGGQEVKLPALQTYTAPALPAATAKAAEDKTKAAEYKTFEFLSPKPNQAIRDNAGMVSIQLSLEPPLQADDSIEILMDGKSVGSGRGTAISLTNVDRGSHSLQASIKDKSGKAIKKTASITFHLKRHSIQ